MKVVLDGLVYTLRAGTGVTRVALTEYADNVRLQGQQTRSDRSNLSSYVIDRWDGGLGVQRRNYNDSNTANRIWDAENIDTRWPSFLILSPAFNVATITPSLSEIGFGFDYVDQLYFAELNFIGSLTPLDATGTTTIYDNPRQVAEVYKFTPPNTLGSHIGLAGTYASKMFGYLRALKVIGNNIIFSARDMDAALHDFYYVPTLGATISTALGLTGLVSAYPQVGDFGGTPHYLMYDSANKKIKMGITNQLLGSMSPVATISGVIGSRLAPLVTDGLTMFVGIADGIYDFDTVPHKVIDLSQSRDINPWQTMFRNYLHFKNLYSTIVYDGADLTQAGYDRDDGLPNDKWGQITAGVSSQKFAFAAVKGPTYSNILAYNGAAWQYYARIPTPGLWVRDMFLSNLPDSIDRLWCIFGNGTYPGYFLNPLTNPLQAATYSFVPTGHITFPIDDGGIIEQQAGFYDMTVVGDAISATNKVTLLYGIDGADPTATLGIVGSTVLSTTFGSPYGISANRIQAKMLFSNNNATGTSPVFRSGVISYLKVPNSRESFDFTIDLEETARAETKPLEAVIGSLNYVRSKRALSAFWYGQMPTKTVRILEQPSAEDVKKEDVYLGERGGFVRVRCAEII